MSIAQVLVVEDDPAIRETLVDVLEEYGFEAVTAVHGLDALRRLGEPEVHPDVILLDLMMPVMDGLTFRKRQLQDPKLSSIPVIVISAYLDCERKAEGMEPAALLTKPVQLGELLRTVEETCATVH